MPDTPNSMPTALGEQEVDEVDENEECQGLPECAGLCCRSWAELHPWEDM